MEMIALARVLVDTSAWIDFFRQKAPVHGIVLELINVNQVCCTGLILAELLQGAKSDTELRVIRDFVHVFDFVRETPSLWRKAGELSYVLRRKGKTVGLADCLLATLARSHDAAILTLDDHFQIIKTQIDIDLYPLMP